MTTSQGRFRRVRTIFLSDLHLGCKYSQAEALLAFLRDQQPDYLYLVGDIIDGWRLKRSWHWTPAFTRIVHEVLDLAAAGTLVRYAPGNHDAFLRHFPVEIGGIEIANEHVHVTADGRRLLVLHGDLFDNVEIRAQWLSVLGSYAYDGLMAVAHAVNRLRRWLKLEPSPLCGNVKRLVKRAVTFVSHFEERLVRHARDNECDGVVCGHVHTPLVTRKGHVAYYNTGDWVENRSALLEYADGSLELVHLPAEGALVCPLPAQATNPAALAGQVPRPAYEELVMPKRRAPLAV
jgi:UDP-2,3-diacylglucosamine pyrophosphatase LpxH